MTPLPEQAAEYAAEKAGARRPDRGRLRRAVGRLLGDVGSRGMTSTLCPDVRIVPERTARRCCQIAAAHWRNARHNRPSEAKVRVDGVVSREGNGNENAHT